MTVIILKVLIALSCGLLGAWMLRTRIMTLSEGAFLRWALALQCVPSLTVFIALYVLGHQEPTSDVPAYYLPAARAALAGQIPFRDFVSSYAPLFSYVGAALVAVWNSGKVFALFDLILNAATLLLWHRSAQACFDARITRSSTVLFAASGQVIVHGLLGTNQSWIATAVAASTLMMVRGRTVSAGLIQAAAACTTKLLAHLFWPVFWICTPRRWQWLAAAVIPTALVYLIFAGSGAGPNLLHPLQFESAQRSSGNLPYVLDLLLAGAGASERLILDGLTAAVLAVTLGWLFFKARGVATGRRPALLPGALALVGLALMIFSKKSFTGYVLFVMYPLVAMLVAAESSRNASARTVAAAPARVGFLVFFNVLLVAEPSLWFHLNGYRYSLREWLVSGGAWTAVGFVGLDLGLLGCYVYLGWLSIGWLQTTADGAMTASKASQSATACSVV